MNKGILKSKTMISMIITLAAGALIMLGFSIFMFIFAGQSSAVYFGDAGNLEERIWQSKTILYGIAIADLLIAAEKIIPFIASVVMYKKYPDPKGLNILKITAVTGAVFYSLLFAGLFIGSFFMAFKSDSGFDMPTFKFFMIMSAVALLPMLKFISMTVMIPSVKQNTSDGVILLSVVTAILIVCNAASLMDMFSLSKTYMSVNMNAGAVFLILVFENLFLFLMTRKYLIMLEKEKKAAKKEEKKIEEKKA